METRPAFRSMVSYVYGLRNDQYRKRVRLKRKKAGRPGGLVVALECHY